MDMPHDAQAKAMRAEQGKELSEIEGLVERVMGFEPTTLCLGSKYSATELHPPNPLF